MSLYVKQIEQVDDRTLKICWSDSVVQSFDVVELRRRCPCAVCIDEWTHQQKLKASDVDESVRPRRIDSVGRYAMNIQFSDQHSTGIYTFTMLREIGTITVTIQ